ncbi:hypothetical protein RDI58_000068 [Solanum bulbocastanum]|uniref:Uncharacterized protein n=1 Tax=Solanum bulbocastanum TaxID=147425 RepID=A0AAN8YM22_SOLBU
MSPSYPHPHLIYIREDQGYYDQELRGKRQLVKMPTSFPMNSGDATYSYSNNSQIQGYRYLIFFGSTLMDLVNEGMLDESLVDSFNVLVYFPSIEDMTKVVEKNDFSALRK